MNAGELRHRVTVNRLNESRTTRGGTALLAPTALYARVPAFVSPLSGRELERAREIDPRISYSVFLRFVEGIKAQQQVIYHAFDGERVLEVVSPPVTDEKSRTMTLMCREATT